MKLLNYTTNIARISMLEKDYEKYKHIIGRNIRLSRAFREMTQEDLGNMVGISQPEIAMYERGINAIKCQTLKKIADILKVKDLNYFFEEHEEL